jgi:hypothetical protein
MVAFLCMCGCQGGKHAVRLDQFIVGAGLHHMASIHDHNEIRRPGPWGEENGQHTAQREVNSGVCLVSRCVGVSVCVCVLYLVSVCVLCLCVRGDNVVVPNRR